MPRRGDRREKDRMDHPTPRGKTPGGESLLEFEMQITKKLDRFSIDLRLRCPAGKTLVLTGPSGAGKTTVLRCIAGFLRPETGRMRLKGRLLLDTDTGVCLSPQKRRIGLVTQEYTLFPHMTLRENVEFAYVGGPEPMALLESSGIARLADQRPARISGGERQRAALCRTLAMCPEMLLLDEPFSALDAENRIRLQELISEVGRKRNIPILHVTHDLSAAVQSADFILAITEGRENRDWLDRQLDCLRSLHSEKCESL